MKSCRWIVSILLTVLLLANLAGSNALGSWRTATRPIGTSHLIDTDLAADDLMAILYLLQRPDVSIKAITVSGTGETHCEPGIQHALGLVTLAGGGDIPVACGRKTPLQGSHAFPNSWRERVDRLYGLTLPKSTFSPSNQNAVELLTSAIQSSTQKVVLLTLGPLTNVAEALETTPSLVNKLEMIYIMGGAVAVPGNVGVSLGIENEAAEWNIYVDPHAASVVFKSGAPITLVPLDATSHVPFTSPFYGRVKNDHTTPEAKFAFDLLTEIRDSFEWGYYYFWDPLAAAISTDEGLATFQTNTVAVVEEGSESGGIKSIENGWTVRVAVSADGPRFEELFLQTLNGRLTSTVTGTVSSIHETESTTATLSQAIGSTEATLGLPPLQFEDRGLIVLLTSASVTILLVVLVLSIIRSKRARVAVPKTPKSDNSQVGKPPALLSASEPARPVIPSPAPVPATTVVPRTAMKFCRFCGARIPRDSRYCEKCGARLA